ncbi:helicase [Auritidibacter sp. NML120779]|nr:helicase [Auritidibacter sp. NML120779]
MREALGYSTVPAQFVHGRYIPAREPTYADWPQGIAEAVREAFAHRGIHRPWLHQAQAIEIALGSEHTILATGTASGKSLAYQAVVASSILADPTATALYLAPTKALGADQLVSWSQLADRLQAGLRPEAYDGDTDPQTRRWVRDHANIVLTNPDMLHLGILPQHHQWARFFRRMRWVIIDEAHSYRGVFGSHVAVVLRRLRRVCAHYHNTDVHFIGASATSSDPATSFAELIGAPVRAVTCDTSGHGAVSVGFWEPEFSDDTGEHGAQRRRSLISTGADFLTDFAIQQIRSMAFIRSRRGAEAMAQSTKRQLSEVKTDLVSRVAAYRSGLLPEERREVEQALDNGKLLAVATTPALELGIDISGLDAVIITGWPGTRASFFQQLGRSGRSGQDSLAIYVAGEDPLDTFLVHHPERIFDIGVEDVVIDPTNPYILGPHLCAAAAELPLTPEDLPDFGPEEHVHRLLEDLTAEGYLRRRPAGWFWTHPDRPAATIGLRDIGGAPLEIVDEETGTVLGTISAEQSHSQAHPGAVYVHQGRTWLVTVLDEDNGVVLVVRAEPNFYTQARETTQVAILNTLEQVVPDSATQPTRLTWNLGNVKVTTRVVSYQRREVITSQILGEEPLELSAQELFTEAVWFSTSSDELIAAGLTTDRMPGALHAAEHAMIGMLPLVASNDRWDIGGVSMVLHPDTSQPTVFIYDGYPGGAGFARRGFNTARMWVKATRDAILACECEQGCPSCVQSPKCGNRNSPLDKPGAVAVLTHLLRYLPSSGQGQPVIPLLRPTRGTRNRRRAHW